MEERSDRAESGGPSMVNELLGRTRRFLADLVSQYAKRSMDDLLRWILGRTIRYAVSGSLFILAAAFLLIGGAKGLIVSGLAPHLAYLAIGAASLLAGFVTLKCCARPCGTK